MMDKMHALGRIGQSVEIATAVAFLCSVEASWVTGITMPIDGTELD